MSEIVQLFTNPTEIPIQQQAQAGDTDAICPVYDNEWGIPEGMAVYCGQCKGLLNDNDLKIGECSGCGFVIPSLRDIVVNDNITQAEYAQIADLKDTINEMRQAGGY